MLIDKYLLLVANVKGSISGVLNISWSSSNC